MSKIQRNAKSYVEQLFGVTPKKIITSSGGFDPHSVPDDFNAESLIDQADAEFDLVGLVGKSVDPLTGVPRDLKLSEGDFKEAANFHDFCTDYRGSDSKFPFARQMWLMLMLFAEVCPRCTPKKMFNIHNLPVDDDPRDIGNKMQLLHYGVCPRCKGTKGEFFRSRELREYYEMSLCIGQRAGKSTTSAAGTEYLTHKYLMYPKMSSVCQGISAATPLTATFVGFRFADAYNLLWTPVINGIKDSKWFCLDENTPITLADGSTKAIKDITIGDEVKTLEGASTVDNFFDNGVKECKTITLDDGKTITGTDEHQVRCVSADGKSLFWKKISELTEDDYVVTE